MLAYRLVVKGRVQRVGFRRYVLEQARALGLKGNVRNEDDDSVHVHAQGDEDTLKRFIELIRSAPPPAYVASVEISPAAVVEDMRSFKIIYGELGDELQEGFGAMQSVFDDYRQEFRSYVGEFREFARRTDQNFAEIKQELRLVREDLKQEIQATREDLKQEIQATREDLKQEIRSVGDKLQAFADRTDKNFILLTTKYDTIAERMDKILAALTANIEILTRILERVSRQ
ncbi:MAG: acylphosphatase [Candidatus Nitrosocaldus sp.]|nr:acylphosphatase [Candidatus Nitrosocaldus sp.]